MPTNVVKIVLIFILIFVFVASGAFSAGPALAQDGAPKQLKEFALGSDLIPGLDASPTGPRPDGVWPALVVNCQKLAEGQDMLCSQYEFGLWDMATGRPIGKQIAETNDVAMAIFHPSGRIAATLHMLKGIVQLWEIADDNSLKPMGKPLEVGSMAADFAFSPDGEMIAAVQTDLTSTDPAQGHGKVKVWNVKTQEALPFVFPVKLDFPGSIRFSPDSRLLAVGDCGKPADMLPIVLESANMDPATNPSGVNQGLKDMATTLGDGGATCAEGVVHLVDVKAGKLVGEVPGLEGAVNTLAFSPDGHYLATASMYDREIQLWDLATQKRAGSLMVGHTNLIGSLIFSPDGQQLFSTSTDGTARVWNVKDALTSKHPGAYVLKNLGRGVWSASFLPGANAFIFGSRGGYIDVYSVPPTLPAPPPQPANPQMVDQDEITDLVVTSDGHILSTAQDCTIGVWDLSGDYLGGALYPMPRPYTSVEFALHPNGHIVALGRQTGNVMLWDLATHALVAGPFLHVEKESTPIRAIDFSADGRWLATGHASGKIYLWDFSKGTPTTYVRILEGHTDKVTSLAFSPDSQTLISGGSDSAVRQWDIAAVAQAVDNGKFPSEVQAKKNEWLDVHLDVINVVMFSPDGKQFATTSVDNTIRIWDAQTGKSIFWPVPEQVWGIAFSPDGKQLATTQGNGEIWLWNMASTNPKGEHVVLGKHDVPAEAVVFMPDGRTVVSGDMNGLIGRWPVH